jgi:hypothetical protein
MPAGLRSPAGSLNHISAVLGTPYDSVRKASALEVKQCALLLFEPLPPR